MRRRSAAQAPEPETMTVAFVGGLDLVTPPSLIPPGRCIAAVNYEPRAEGYSRIDGLERLDGHTKPSEASYSILNFHVGTAAITAGQTVTGMVSGATGVMLADAVVQSGTYGGSNAAGYLALGAITGTFQNTEGLSVGGVQKAVSNSLAVDRGASSDVLDAQYLATAIVNARNLIQPVPGTGPVRGAAILKRTGDIYAFRNNGGATLCPMWKATATGWQSVPLGWSLKFTTTGATAIAVGATVTGATSGATGTVARVILDGDQAWPASGTLTGRLILSAKTGTFQAAENITVAAVNRGVAAGAATDNTPPAGGRYEFVNKNFYGATSLGALYGVNGVGPGFEFDGTIFSPIITGAPTETPQHIAAHKGHLFLSFPNGQLQGSQSGLPQGWNGSLGATTFGMGDDITGLLPEVAGVMAVFCLTRIGILSGSIAADFSLNDGFSDESGAVEWTAQTLNGPAFMDMGGVRNLSTTQAFGNFKLGTMTMLVQPLLDAKRLAGIVPVASLRVRNKSQYRLYFSDGTGICIFIGGKQPSVLPFDYGTRIPTCMFGGNYKAGGEILLMGCADGYVYQLDKGMSMDGGTIDHYLRPAFNACGSPAYNKRFHQLWVQVSNAPIASIFMTAAFSDGDPDQPPVTEQSFTVYGGGAFWNEANWNQFVWSSRVIGKAVAECEGVGSNFAPTIGGSSTTEKPHILSTYTVKFSMRGPVRA